jgi:glycosyltransferase involved in cell wall biosynthesis
MMPLFAAMGWPLLRLAKIPIVMWYAHKSVNTVLRVATLLVDRVVASSESGFRLKTQKLRIVGQGIDTNRFSPLPDLGARRSRFTILTLGRISPIKRLEILIEAVAMEVDKRLDVDMQVKIVGGPLSGADEEYLELLKKKSRNYGMEGQVEFIGNKSFPDVHHYYQSADCFVNVSDTDSADKAVLEAMSCGLPVITSNVAFREILGAELSSRWVIAKGDAASLSDRIIAISSMTAAEREGLGGALRKIVMTDHSLPALSRKISGEIYSLIGDGNQ